MHKQVDPVHHTKIYAVAGIAIVVFSISLICLLRPQFKRSKVKKNMPGISYLAPSEERALPIRPPLHRFKRQ